MEKRLKTIALIFFAFFLVQIIVVASESVDESAVNAVNIDVVANIFSQVVEPCSPVLFNLSVVNTGSFDEKYFFSVKQVSGVEILPSDVVLQPGQKQDVLVRFVPDDCSLFGNFPVVFSARTENTGLVADVDLSLEIVPVDVLVISKDVTVISANHYLSTAKIHVKNEGAQLASYNLSIEAPDWVKLDSQRIDVGAGSESDILLIINPAESVVDGEYELVVSAESETSRRVYSRQLFVKLSGKNFFARASEKLSFVFQIVNSPWFSYFVVGLFVLLVFAFVARKFAHKKPVDEDFDGAAKETEDGTLFDSKARKLVEKDLRSQFKLVPKSSVISLPVMSRKFFVVGLLLVVLCILGVAGYFFRNLLAIYLDYVVLGVLILVFLFGISMLFKYFSVSRRFKFLLAGDSAELMTGWKQGLVRLSCEVVDNVENLRVFVSKQVKYFVLPKNTVYACSIASNCDASLFAKVSLDFRINKSVLSQFNAVEKDLRVFSLVDGKWKSIGFEVCGSDARCVCLQVSAETIGVFAVACKDKLLMVEAMPVVRQELSEEKIAVTKVVEKKSVVKSSRKQKNNSKIIAYVVLFALLVLVAGAFVYLFKLEPPVTPAAVAGISSQVWGRDTVHSLDVGKFFVDPDGDVLTFAARPVENIKIELNEGIATFTADAGWTGERSTVFTATDPSGASASSNEVSLVVKKPFIPTSLTPYLSQIIGGVLFVVVVVLLLVFRDKIIKFLDDEDE